MQNVENDRNHVKPGASISAATVESPPSGANPPSWGPVSDAGLSQLVTHSQSALFLVGCRSTILYRNGRADELLTKGLVVRSVDGKLIFSTRGGTCLCDLLANYWQGSVGTANTRFALKGLDGSLWLAQIRMIACDGVSEPTLAVVLREASIDLDGASELVSDLFGLTKAERRALPAVLRIGQLRRVANCIGVSVTTIRTHLSHIYAKTSTRRRNDLFKLVARFATVAWL